MSISLKNKGIVEGNSTFTISPYSGKSVQASLPKTAENISQGMVGYDSPPQIPQTTKPYGPQNHKDVENLWPLPDDYKEQVAAEAFANLNNVIANATIISKAFPELTEALSKSVSTHDATKYTDRERYGYAWEVVSKTPASATLPDNRAIQQLHASAMCHHRFNNPHHIEYWEARDGSWTMPKVELAHALADWADDCQRYGGSLKKVIGDALDSYIWTEEQRRFMLAVLRLFPDLDY